MKVTSIYRYGLCAVLLAGTTGGGVPLAAQDAVGAYETGPLEARVFDAERWEDLHESLDYSGKPPKPKKKPEPETPDAPTPPPSPDSSFDQPDLSPLVKVLLVILLVGLLGWLIYSIGLHGEMKFDTPLVTDGEPEEVDLKQVERLEEELDRRDVDPYLVKAETTEQYALAVRLQYLALLKKLHEQGLIRWKKNRTNRYYLNEMRDHPTYTGFRDLTLTFERVWYGNYTPDAEEYRRIKSGFTAYRERLTPLAHA